MVAGSLQKVVEASWVNSHQKQVLQSLRNARAKPLGGGWDNYAGWDAAL